MMGLPFSLNNPFAALSGALPDGKMQDQKGFAGSFSHGKWGGSAATH